MRIKLNKMKRLLYIFILAIAAASLAAFQTAPLHADDPPSNPVPLTDGISPGYTTIGNDGIVLSVNGQGFVPGSVVRFDGSGRTTTFVSATLLRASIPASDLAATGTYNITVFNPAPGRRYLQCPDFHRVCAYTGDQSGTDDHFQV